MDDVAIYEAVPVEIDSSVLVGIRQQPPDLLVFTSSSNVRNFVSAFGPDQGKRILCDSTVAVLGPITAQTARSFGKNAEIVPKENTGASLLEAIREYYGS